MSVFLRRLPHRAWFLIVAWLALLAVGCGSDDAQEAADIPGVTSSADDDGRVAATGTDDESAAPVGSDTPVVVSSDGSATDAEDAVDTDSSSVPLDAEPLGSDPSGDLPAGPAAPGAGDGSTAPSGDATTSGGADPAADPALPRPTIDSDTSPDDGDVPNGVSGDSEVRENLSFPTASVVALDNGAPTTLAAELASAARPTLLWFWSPDCPTCAPESSVVDQFADTYRSSIRVIGVGAGGSRAEAEAFASDQAIDPSLLLWDPSAATHAHYNVTATPFVIMVDPSGVVMAQWRGMVPELFQFADRL